MKWSIRRGNRAAAHFGRSAKRMMKRFIIVPAITAIIGMAALMLDFYAVGKQWANGTSPWLEHFARWDNRTLLIPLFTAFRLCPSLNHFHPYLLALVLYGLLGLGLVLIWEGGKKLIRRKSTAEPAH